MSFRVLSVEGTEIRCQAIIGGDLSDHKSMSFPNKVLKQPYLSEQDKKDLLLGIENGVDFIAASFVSCQQDILDLKAFLSAHGGGTIDIIAKILGHTNTNMTRHYARISEANISREMRKIGKMLTA